MWACKRLLGKLKLLAPEGRLEVRAIKVGSIAWKDLVVSPPPYICPQDLKLVGDPGASWPHKNQPTINIFESSTTKWGKDILEWAKKGLKSRSFRLIKPAPVRIKPTEESKSLQ